MKGIRMFSACVIKLNYITVYLYVRTYNIRICARIFIEKILLSPSRKTCVGKLIVCCISFRLATPYKI